MMKIDTYLNFNGHTEEVFLHYSKIFNTDIGRMIRYSELPGSEKMPEADRNKVFHVSMVIGTNELMGTDVLETPNQRLNMGDNFSLRLTVAEEAEGRRIFDGLSEEGTVVMPLAQEEWSKLFGICKDKFGIQWMINVN
jgi:PhnB protein